MDNMGISIILGMLAIIIGFLAQRSRMCFVAGLRDYLLVRDTELLLGVFTFLVTVWVLTSVGYAVGLLKPGIPEYGSIEIKSRLPGAVKSQSVLKNLQEPHIIGEIESSGKHPTVFNRFFYVSLVGGWLMGGLSVLAGGCVLRQHVLCAQGNRNALLYLLGFYSAVVIYDLFFFKVFSWFYQ
jgi:hypothetical protein